MIRQFCKIRLCSLSLSKLRRLALKLTYHIKLLLLYRLKPL